MKEIRQLWEEFVFDVRRLCFGTLREVMASRFAQLNTRIAKWKRPDEWVPMVEFEKASRSLEIVNGDVRALCRELAELRVGDVRDYRNHPAFDAMRHEAMQVGAKGAYERGLRDAEAIKAWRESAGVIAAVKNAENEFGKAAWEVGDEHFEDLENAVAALLTMVKSATCREL